MPSSPPASPPGSEFLWDHHYAVYWDLSQRTYREEIDPQLRTTLLEAGIPFCASGVPYCDADYDYASRPPAVQDAVAKVSLTGRIGKPMITLHGTLDALLPIAPIPIRMRAWSRTPGAATCTAITSSRAATMSTSCTTSSPIACARSRRATARPSSLLEQWVENKLKPPENRTLARPASGDLANECSLN